MMIATRARTSITAQNAAMIAQEFVEDQLGNLIGTGRPYQMVSGLQSAWSIPLVLTSPGYGVVGTVGAVMVDMEFGHIIGWTPIEEVRANAEALTDENEAAVEAAFQSHRKTNRQPQL
jgi:hypothetical protein